MCLSNKLGVGLEGTILDVCTAVTKVHFGIFDGIMILSLHLSPFVEILSFLDGNFTKLLHFASSIDLSKITPVEFPNPQI